MRQLEIPAPRDSRRQSRIILLMCLLDRREHTVASTERCDVLQTVWKTHTCMMRGTQNPKHPKTLQICERANPDIRLSFSQIQGPFMQSETSRPNPYPKPNLRPTVSKNSLALELQILRTPFNNPKVISHLTIKPKPAHGSLRFH